LQENFYVPAEKCQEMIKIVKKLKFFNNKDNKIKIAALYGQNNGISQ